MEKGGLSSQEAQRAQKQYGLNKLEDVAKTSSFKILWRQIRNNFVIYLLVAAMILSFWVEKSITGYTLLVIILVVIIIGFLQEYRAEKAIESLQNMITPVSIVIRDGREQEIASQNLVPGDIVLLRTGERVPADCTVIEHYDLSADESILTGESHEVRKVAQKGTGDDNVLYMGSFIVSGRARALVTRIGMATKFGSIAKLISKQEKELPLEKKVNHIAKYAVVVSIIAAILVGFFMLIRADEITTELLVEMAIIMIALAVSAFPESFPVVLITTLSAGVYRMAKQNAIVNRMSVIETLGETTVICSDKTGTLTKGEMTVKHLYLDGLLMDITGSGYTTEGSFLLDGKRTDMPLIKKIAEAAALCNDSSIHCMNNKNECTIIGSPTEAALLVMGAKAGVTKESLTYDRKAEIPFTSERKYMSVLVTKKGESLLIAKGAPEHILSRCTKIERSNGIFSLTDKERRKIESTISELNDGCYRTLAIAYSPSSTLQGEKDVHDLIFLGLAALEDPPREEVSEAIKLCIKAGIQIKMITGDNVQTAKAIANQIGLHGQVMTGEELDRITDRELNACVTDIVIFARVRPEHKLRIVNVLKDRGEVVTMTGDGVNDAPALKAAQIGVAMGKNGTDVSRSVADLTLRDDNFSTIVNAVREGRTIFNNMRKFITYQLGCNTAEIMILLLAIILGWPLPLVAIQILFMNLVTDDFPAITLGLNPSSRDIMDQKPRRKSHLIAHDHIMMIIISGVVMGLGTLAAFAYSFFVLGESIEIARTTALVTLVLFEIAGAYNFRSFRKGVLTRSLWTNKYLLYASLLSLAATLAIIYTPINSIFEVVPISANAWIISLVPSILLVVLFDVLKKINEKKHFWKDIV